MVLMMVVIQYKLSFIAKKTNLHEVWDTKIIERWQKDVGQAVTQLEDIISDNPNMVNQYLSVMNPINWANESFQFVLTTCYNFSDNEIITSASQKFSSVPHLGDAYYNRNLPIIQNRLIAAGVRLGALLDQLLSMIVNKPSIRIN